MMVLFFFFIIAVIANEQSLVRVDSNVDISLLKTNDLDLVAFKAISENDLDQANHAFREIVRRDPADAFALMWWGNIAVRLGDFEAAENHFATAAATIENRLPTEDPEELFSRSAQLGRFQMNFNRAQGRSAFLKAMAAGMGNKNNITSYKANNNNISITAIPRINVKDLSLARFEAEFAIPRKPVVIEGLANRLTKGSPMWTPEYLKRLCGHLTPPLKRFKPSSAAWASLEDISDTLKPGPTLADILDSMARTSQSATTKNDGVVFDWPLRATGSCARLLANLSVPTYFAASLVGGYGPSLFVQGNGSKCGLHVDWGSTHFWQLVWAGEKRWRIFDPSDLPRLYDAPSFEWNFFRDTRCTGLFGAAAVAAASCDNPVGGVALDAFDNDALGELARSLGGLRVAEATVHPGDIIFVPADAPHQVTNRGAVTVAVSMNFVDKTNAVNAYTRIGLEGAEAHPERRQRLAKQGAVIGADKARWYERYMLLTEPAEAARLRQSKAK